MRSDTRLRIEAALKVAIFTRDPFRTRYGVWAAYLITECVSLTDVIRTSGTPRSYLDLIGMTTVGTMHGFAAADKISAESNCP